MCLGIPAKILRISGSLAEVEIAGVIRQASIQLVDEPKVGDYILLHAGFAIQKIDEEEAVETLKLLEEIDEIR